MLALTHLEQCDRLPGTGGIQDALVEDPEVSGNPFLPVGSPLGSGQSPRSVSIALPFLTPIPDQSPVLVRPDPSSWSK